MEHISYTTSPILDHCYGATLFEGQLLADNYSLEFTSLPANELVTLLKSYDSNLSGSLFNKQDNIITEIRIEFGRIMKVSVYSG